MRTTGKDAERGRRRKKEAGNRGREGRGIEKGVVGAVRKIQIWREAAGGMWLLYTSETFVLVGLPMAVGLLSVCFFPFLLLRFVPLRLALPLAPSLALASHTDERTRDLSHHRYLDTPSRWLGGSMFLVKENSRGTPALITTLYSTRVSFYLRRSPSFCARSRLLGSARVPFAAKGNQRALPVSRRFWDTRSSRASLPAEASRDQSVSVPIGTLTAGLSGFRSGSASVQVLRNPFHFDTGGGGGR